MTDVSSEFDAETDAEIVVYWRPGCGFCSSLRGQLERASVPHQLVNIWEDPSAAATVRSIANGNETVPTVVVGPIGMVNPSIHEVLAAAGQYAPHAVPADYVAPEPSRFSRWISSKLGGE